VRALLDYVVRHVYGAHMEPRGRLFEKRYKKI